MFNWFIKESKKGVQNQENDPYFFEKSQEIAKKRLLAHQKQVLDFEIMKEESELEMAKIRLERAEIEEKLAEFEESDGVFGGIDGAFSELINNAIQGFMQEKGISPKAQPNETPPSIESPQLAEDSIREYWNSLPKYQRWIARRASDEKIKSFIKEKKKDVTEAELEMCVKIVRE